MIDGQRESETSWTALLLDCKSRGMTEAAKLATGDGSLGFWIALSKVFPLTRQQCQESVEPRHRLSLQMPPF